MVIIAVCLIDLLTF